MARNAVTKLYTAIPGGSTQGTDLRTWMAENLTALTVGRCTPLARGASGRNWWTLTFPGGAEILVACQTAQVCMATTYMLSAKTW